MRAVASISSLLLLLSPVAAVPSLQAGSNLLENSPFLPPSAVGGAAQEAAPLELRSILKAGNEYEFSLFDAAKKQSTWVRLNEAGHDFVVKAFDPETASVTVEQRSRTYKLSLKEAKIIPLSTAPAAAPSFVGAGPSSAPGTGPQMIMRGQPGSGPGGRNQAGPIPVLTPEQLRNLEADINRRRELRRQAMATSGQSPPAQPPPSGQTPPPAPSR
jgi:hypothetical protein